MSKTIEFLHFDIDESFASNFILGKLDMEIFGKTESKKTWGEPSLNRFKVEFLYFSFSLSPQLPECPSLVLYRGVSDCTTGRRRPYPRGESRYNARVRAVLVEPHY